MKKPKVFLAVAKRHDPKLYSMAYAELKKLGVQILEWNVQLHPNHNMNVQINMANVNDADAILFIPDIDFEIKYDEDNVGVINVGRGIYEMYSNDEQIDIAVMAMVVEDAYVRPVLSGNLLDRDDYRNWGVLELGDKTYIQAFLIENGFIPHPDQKPTKTTNESDFLDRFKL